MPNCGPKSSPDFVQYAVLARSDCCDGDLLLLVPLSLFPLVKVVKLIPLGNPFLDDPRRPRRAEIAETPLVHDENNMLQCKELRECQYQQFSARGARIKQVEHFLSRDKNHLFSAGRPTNISYLVSKEYILPCQ